MPEALHNLHWRRLQAALSAHDALAEGNVTPGDIAVHAAAVLGADAGNLVARFVEDYYDPKVFDPASCRLSDIEAEALVAKIKDLPRRAKGTAPPPPMAPLRSASSTEATPPASSSPVAKRPSPSIEAVAYGEDLNLQRLQKRLRDEQAALATARNRVEEEQANLAAARKRAEQGQAALAAARRQLEDDQSALAAARRALEAELANATARRAEEEQAALEAARRRFEAEEAAAAASARRAQEEEAALRAAQKRVDEEQAALNAAQARAREEEKVVEATERRLSEEARLEKLAGNLQLTEQDIDATNAKKLEAEIALTLLQGQLANSQQEQIRIERERSEQEAKLATLQKRAQQLSETAQLNAEKQLTRQQIDKAEALIGAKSYDDAIQTLIPAVKVDPDNLKALELLAFAYSAANDRTRSIETLTRLTKLPDALPSHWRSLGQSQRLAGKEAAAIESFREALKRDPEDIEALRSLGSILKGRRDYAGAIGALCKAAEITGGTREDWAELGLCYRSSNDRKNARLAYQRCLAADNNQPTIWYALGGVYSEDKDWEKAASAFKQCLELNPHHYRAQQQLEAALKHTHSKSATTFVNVTKPSSPAPTRWQKLKARWIAAAGWGFLGLSSFLSLIFLMQSWEYLRNPEPERMHLSDYISRGHSRDWLLFKDVYLDWPALYFNPDNLNLPPNPKYYSGICPLKTAADDRTPSKVFIDCGLGTAYIHAGYQDVQGMITNATKDENKLSWIREHGSFNAILLTPKMPEFARNPYLALYESLLIAGGFLIALLIRPWNNLVKQ